MNKNILVINAGSSSLKFKLYDWDMKQIASGNCERIGIDGLFKMDYLENNETKKYSTNPDFSNHDLAIDFLLNKLLELKILNSLDEIKGVGHRIVQGGTISQSCVVDDAVLKEIEDCISLAPLHNKPEADVLKIVMNKIKGVKNVVVFDTSFHTTIPKVNYYYAVPTEWVEKYKIKKYGFHGTSYRFINEKMNLILNKKDLNLIICHLGNGASICCVKDGKSYDTTMGLTPLCGLVMGTRSGDIDASIFDLVARQTNKSCQEIFNDLNKNSGLKAICGSSDFRDIEEKTQPNNEYDFATQLFVQRVVNYVATFINHLENKVDAIVFTAGIGENAPEIRDMVCKKIKGLEINKAANESKIGEFQKISQPLSKWPIYVVRTNEEIKIAQDTKKLVE
ncbi:MAG: acetate kinase [Malacoplasma sp.]|nr:acetate kinase [Malacoplasma sp.]